ncbi:MAG TPA: ferredoxin [Myxococcales bacterium]|nr:ferredoxin [Myxococcales bacterium]HAN31704.1 ferredoxin [Myxococcales bacterium]
MAYIITRLCVDCKDTACADVCPVECIYTYEGDDKEAFPNQLYINPDECIDCTNCEPACPWMAIFEEDEVPSVFEPDVDLAYAMAEQEEEFEIAEVTRGHAPTQTDVETNYAKYDYTP